MSNVRDRTKLVEAKLIVEGQLEFELYWHQCDLLLSICMPIFNLMRLSDKCCAGFSSFAHFAVSSLRSTLKSKIMSSVKKFTNSQFDFFNEDNIEQLMQTIDDDITSRIVYMSTPAIIISRLLNPALRKKNLLLSANEDFIQPLTDLFSLFPGFKDTLVTEYDEFRSTSSMFALVAEKVAPHIWWKNKGADLFPHLSALAMRITQSSSSASMTERQWSFLDFQIGQRRKHLVQFNYPTLTKREEHVDLRSLVPVLKTETRESHYQADKWAEKLSQVDDILIENEVKMSNDDLVPEMDSMMYTRCDDVEIEVVEKPEQEHVTVSSEEEASLIDEIDEPYDITLIHGCIGPSACKPRRSKMTTSQKKSRKAN
ncbi:hypothetical protein GEMRC1_010633 [Eukaryota sp. GEM-RC1]